MSMMDDTKVSRAEALARRLEAAVAGGELPPGRRLGTKEELKQRYGVAAGTLNEALRLLQIRGFVEARPGPGGGLFAAAPSATVRLSHLILGFREGGATASNCLEVRNALEPLLVAEATRHRTEEDVRDLRAILGQMAEHAGDPAGFLRANWRLHRRMAQISQNVVLRGVYVTVLDFAEEQLDEVRGDDVFRTDVRDNLAIHEELVEALASGDLERARTAAERHSPLTAWQTGV